MINTTMNIMLNKKQNLNHELTSMSGCQMWKGKVQMAFSKHI